MLHKALLNPHCRGAVTFKGAEERPGVHRSLVEQALWRQAQAVLDARRRGQRERLHRHCLKPALRPAKRTGQTPHTRQSPNAADKESPATTKKPPRRPPHTTNEPWSLHDQGSHKTIVAVAAGFEPAVAINHTAFRVLHLRPLGHATADYRSGITPHSATRQPVGRDTSPDCTSIVEPMPGSARPKRASIRHAAHSPHAADVVPVFRVSPRRRRPACAKPSRLRDFLPHPAAPRVRKAVPQADRHERPLKRRPRLKASADVAKRLGRQRRPPSRNKHFIVQKRFSSALVTYAHLHLLLSQK